MLTAHPLQEPAEATLVAEMSPEEEWALKPAGRHISRRRKSEVSEREGPVQSSSEQLLRAESGND